MARYPAAIGTKGGFKSHLINVGIKKKLEISVYFTESTL